MPSVAVASERSNRILDVAERLVQVRGFNAFNYADVAGVLRITKASLHHHFPTKAKLGERLIERYQKTFLAVLDHIDRSSRDAGAKLQAYVGIYAGVLANNRMCLCGMLAADYATLPKPMKDRVRRFFEANEGWLGDVLGRGRESGELAFAGAPVETARLFVAALEGAMLLARPFEDPSRLRAAADCFLTGLGVRPLLPEHSAA